MYVSSNMTAQVLRYNGQTGAFLNVFANTNIGQGLIGGPAWLQFGTDGYLYTTGWYPANSVRSFLRFNAATGAFVDLFQLHRDGWSFNLSPANIVYDSSNGAGAFVERFGSSSLAAFTVSLDAPSSGPVAVNYSTASGTATSGPDFTPESGTLTFAPGQTSRTILVQTIDDTIPEPTETFSVNLSNPVGATIANAASVGTILDNDAVQVSAVHVNDGSAQRSEVRSIAVTFTGQVTLPANPADAFQLQHLTDGNTVALAATAATDGLGRTVVTLTFSGAETDPLSSQNGGSRVARRRPLRPDDLQRRGHRLRRPGPRWRRQRHGRRRLRQPVRHVAGRRRAS